MGIFRPYGPNQFGQFFLNTATQLPFRLPTRNGIFPESVPVSRLYTIEEYNDIEMGSFELGLDTVPRRFPKGFPYWWGFAQYIFEVKKILCDYAIDLYSGDEVGEPGGVRFDLSGSGSVIGLLRGVGPPNPYDRQFRLTGSGMISYGDSESESLPYALPYLERRRQWDFSGNLISDVTTEKLLSVNIDIRWNMVVFDPSEPGLIYPRFTIEIGDTWNTETASESATTDTYLTFPDFFPEPFPLSLPFVSPDGTASFEFTIAERF